MKGSVCFVGGGVRTLLGLPDGGSERQIALLATELSRRGSRVSLVVPGLREECRIGGIDVRSGWNGEKGWPKGLRFWTHRLPELKRIIGGIEPDLLYTRGFSLFAPAVASVSGKTGATYLAALACDDDLRTRALSRTRGFVQSAGYGFMARALFKRFALGRADLVLSQHGGQASECRRMKLPSRIVRNVFAPPAVIPPDRTVFDAAWVGHISEFKGFDRLLDIAGRARGLKIAVAGAVQGGRNNRLVELARTIPGISYLGEMPHDGVLALMAGSSVLLNTSPTEGFPNTFLEAWYLGKPVVSLSADPDGVLSSDAPPGLCGGGDTGATADALVRLCGDREKRMEMGGRGRSIVERDHLVAAVVDSLEEAFLSSSGST